MSFQNDTQRGTVAQVLTDRLGKGVMFAVDVYGVPRPTAGIEKHKRYCYSAYEVFMVRLAWDVWNGRGKASFDNALTILDGLNLQMVGELLVAVADSSSSRVVNWIADWTPP